MSDLGPLLKQRSTVPQVNRSCRAAHLLSLARASTQCCLALTSRQKRASVVLKRRCSAPSLWMYEAAGLAPGGTTARTLAPSKEAFDTPLSPPPLDDGPGPATGLSDDHPDGTLTRRAGPVFRTHRRLIVEVPGGHGC